MIKSIKHKGLRELWEAGSSRKLPADQINRIERILKVINDAQKIPQDFQIYKNWNLHKLTGDLKDFWAGKVNANYRIIFRFEDHHSYDIDYIDYH